MVAPKPRARKLAKSNGPALPRGRVAGSRDDAWIDPGRRGEKLSVFEFPTFMLERLSGLVKRSFMPSYIEPFGIGIPEWRVLVTIASHSALSFNEICGVLTMDRAQVSRTLGMLLKKSLVTQVTTVRSERGRGQGRTQTRMTLTAEGSRIYKRLMPVAQQHQMILISALDERERAIVYNAVWKLISAAGLFETKRSAKPLQQSKRSSASAGRAKPMAEKSNSSRELLPPNVTSHGNAGP